MACPVTGISLSEEQLKIARERADKESAGDDVRFLFQDYREVEGTFDRIVSVGMFEHVGLPLYRTFFKSVRDHLTDDGIALLQTIGRTDGPGATDSWTLKYIFPGGYAPALSEIVPHVEKAGFYITDVEDATPALRLHVEGMAPPLHGSSGRNGKDLRCAVLPYVGVLSRQRGVQLPQRLSRQFSHSNEPVAGGGAADA